MGEVHLRLLATNGFQAKTKNEDLLLRDRVVIRTSKMKISGRRLTSKNCPKKRAARAARLCFLIPPIILLICGVVVAVVRSHRRSFYCHGKYIGKENFRTPACIAGTKRAIPSGQYRSILPAWASTKRMGVFGTEQATKPAYSQIFPPILCLSVTSQDFSPES